MEAFKKFPIPLPSIDIQEDIISEVKKNEEKIKKLKDIIANEKQKQEKEIIKCFENYDMKEIGRYSLLLKRGKSAKYGNSSIQVIKSGQARGYMSFDFSTKYYADKNYVSDERNLIKGDLLINSTGVGTAGRVTLFYLDGDYIVDSHITILRLDQKQILPKYALYSLAHIGFKNIEAMANGQSGQIELSIDTIKNIKIPIPPIDIQYSLVKLIEMSENIIDNAINEIQLAESFNFDILDKHLC